MKPRPASIRWFEGIACLSLLLSVVYSNLFSRQMSAAAISGTADGRRGALWLMPLLMLAVYIPLIIAAARRASRNARLILTGLLGLHLVMILNLAALLTQEEPLRSLSLIQFPMSAAMIWLLFRPDSEAWFARVPPVDPGVFR